MAPRRLSATPTPRATLPPPRPRSTAATAVAQRPPATRATPPPARRSAPGRLGVSNTSQWKWTSPTPPPPPSPRPSPGPLATQGPPSNQSQHSPSSYYPSPPNSTDLSHRVSAQSYADPPSLTPSPENADLRKREQIMTESYVEGMDLLAAMEFAPSMQHYGVGDFLPSLATQKSESIV